MRFQNVVDAGRIAAGGLMDLATGLVNPTLRLGVTGLSRSGKTVFITALVHALTKGTRLPVFEAYAQGRITRAYLEPQPDDDLPRFAYEDHLARLIADDRAWPEGTRRISQLRLTLEYEPHGLIARNFGSGKLHIDLVDYPGEWLLDLPLMNLSFRQWSEATIAASRNEPRASLAKAWHAHLATLDAESTAIELNAVKAAEHFTAYLAKCREDDVALSSLLPGRFLMPGDFAGSPLLTFAPLIAKKYDEFPKGSLGDLMQRRYDSYVSKIVRPFFFSHFARLDRQIVLVDTLSALNAGPAAVQDLKNALTQVLACFRLGANSIFSTILGRRIDRILFAATKADLLHQTSHDRLENILRLIIEDASAKAEFSGAAIDVAALAAIRATREAKVKQKNEELPCIAGIPQNGERIGGTTFDGESEVAIFPGDLPANTLDALDGTLQGKLKFVRFRPPPLKDGAFPHIRLDRSLEFLLGGPFRMTGNHRKPAAFVLDDEEKPKSRHKIEFETQESLGELVAVPQVPRRTSKGFRWGFLLVSALATLLSLWAGLTITTLIENFFSRSATLGWFAFGVAGLAGLAAIAIIVREIWGLARLRRIEHIQELSARAINLDEAAAAAETVASLEGIYGSRPDTAWNMKMFRDHKADIMDPRDRIRLLDRLVIGPLDEESHRIIARRARRVTLLTTVTPAAALDLVFVAAQNLRMLRELAELYGGRPSTLSTLKLARMVVSHLAVTGGLALSDNLIQHVVGKGLLGRLSARFGEGAVNGILTSRIGLAARDVCRPVPQSESTKETLGSLLRELVTLNESKTP